MRLLIVQRLLISGLFLVPQVGCVSFFWHKGEPTANEQGAPVLELRPSESAKVCFATAESLEKGGKETEAVQMYERARQLDVKVANQATRRMANLYGRLGEFDKAKQEYVLALQQNPNDAELLNDFGYCYYCRGLWDDSEKRLRQSIAINPKNGRAWSNLGMTLAQKGETKESLEAFQKTVSPGQAYCNLGFLLATQGKRNEACDAFKEALKHEPDLQRAAVAIAKLEAGANTAKTIPDRTPPLRAAATRVVPSPTDGATSTPAPIISDEPIFVPAPTPSRSGTVSVELSEPPPRGPRLPVPAKN